MHITIAVCGFQHEVWRKEFFPDDLPSDWYFDYYANEFNAVLLSEYEQVYIGSEVLNEMLKEADVNFTFVLEDCELARSARQSEVECEMLFINSFFSRVNISELNDNIVVEQAELIVNKKANKKIGQNINKTACVLRVTSTVLATNQDIKQILAYVRSNFTEYTELCLFLGQRMQDMSTINTTKIINDLL